jgi:MarR family 2-MHQ and catechol resistance regulon transcriptional repressor
MTVVIDNLEKQGLVERRRSSEDRRSTIIQLTEKGKQLFDQVFVQHAQFVEELIWSVLPEEEITQLSGLLKKLGVALKSRL